LLREFSSAPHAHESAARVFMRLRLHKFRSDESGGDEPHQVRTLSATGSARSSQISRQYGCMLLGQSIRQALYRAWQMTESRTTAGVFISTIVPVFSSMILSTRRRTR